MEWLRRLPRTTALVSLLFTIFLIQSQVHCLHIRPQQCHNSMGDLGTCMFVWECIKTEGKHLGTCADGFLFGSCCAHSDSKNNIIPSVEAATTTESHKKPASSTSTTTSSKPSTFYSKSTELYTFTTDRPQNFFTASSTSYHTKPYPRPPYLKPSSTTFKPVFIRPTFKPPSTTFKPVFIKSTSKPFSTTFKPAFTRLTTKPSSTTSNAIFIRPTFKPLSTTFKPIFARPTSEPTRNVTSTTIVYQPMYPESNSDPGNLTSIIKTTKNPTIISTTNKYGYASSTQNWVYPASYQPPYVSTKQPIFSTKKPTTHRPSVTYWTSKYPYFRPSWKPTLKPTFTNSSTSNPFIYTYSTNNYTARPSFTPFTTKTSHLTTLNSISQAVNTPSYTPELLVTSSTAKPKTNTTQSDSSFTTTTTRPRTTTSSSSQRPFTTASNGYSQSFSTTHSWSNPTTLFSTSHDSSSFLTNVSVQETFTTQLPQHPAETFSPIMANYSTKIPPLDVVTSIGTKTTTPLPVTPCGMPTPHPQKKVVGGTNSAFGSWPWQASVRRTSFFGFSSTHRCGGALISRQWVATAGHCVDDLLLSQIKIRVGEYDFASVQEPHGYVERGVTKKVVHPRYNFFTYENDLALVQLEEAIDPIKHPHISPICLPPNEENLVGRNATVTGWGRLSEGGVLPSILQEVQVPIISNEKCKNMFLAAGRHEYIPDIFMCAGFEEGGRDSCQGDSGGPLQIQADEGYWFLAGIISWGIGCAEPNMPGVCTRISKFKDWVVQQIT